MEDIQNISCSDIGGYQINGVSAKSIIQAKFHNRLFNPARKVSSDRICYYFIRCMWVFSIIKEEYKNMTFSDGNKEYTNNTCYVSDSYRPANAGYGSSVSAHIVGAAIDINAGNNNVKAAEEALFICVVNTLAKYRIKWDQLLYETRGSHSKWTHLALFYDGDQQRQRIQRFHNDKSTTVNQYNEFKALFPIEKCPHLWVDENTLKPNMGLSYPPSGVQLW